MQIVSIENNAMIKEQKINEMYVNNESDILMKNESLKQKYSLDGSKVLS
jgi:formylmethanofuran dehydrogenase subunit D